MDEPPRKSMKLIHDATEIMSLETEITEKDLPLLSNVDQVRVRHYLMKLKTDFTTKCINGTLILFLEWSQPDICQPPKIILDACCLKVKQVYMLKTAQDYDAKQNIFVFNESGNRKNFYRSNNQQDWFAVKDDTSQLQFSVEKWSLSIHGWDHSGLPSYPSVIRIDYETLESSPSFHWRPCEGYSYDLDPRKCLYSPAPPVNNRGLFPCQEPPSAVATWEVIMEVEDEYIPLLTSDEPGEIICKGERTTTHYFYTSIPLPMSTFAMAIAKYCFQTDLIAQTQTEEKEQEDAQVVATVEVCRNHCNYPCRFSSSEKCKEQIIPARLFCIDKDCISTLDSDRLSRFINCCLKTCFNSVGPHPFSRLDLVVMPKCFPHMGLANPYMVFLSPSNFTGLEEPLFVCRIPHEICHSWFGLLIGALNWTEEWLSEGFATYYEDIVFLETYHQYFPFKTIDEVKKEHVLKICMRFITLRNELQNTDNELHVMSRESEDNSATKNGLVPIKQFMTVHYYKGYLLLWHLASLVGQPSFIQFLREYVWKYHGQLVTSDIFLNSYYVAFKDRLYPNENFVSVTELKREWLESNALPKPYDSLNILDEEVDVKSFPLFADAKDYLVNLKQVFQSLQQGKVPEGQLDGLSCTELLILLEHVLNIATKDVSAFKQCYEQLVTSSVFSLGKQNPDVVHRWCEMIILRKDKTRLEAVKQFLKNNIAMGVYLYGELMISEKRSFQNLAKRLYSKLEKLYDMATKRLLKEMIF